LKHTQPSCHQKVERELVKEEFKRRPECDQLQNPINEPLGKERTILVLF